MEIAENQRDALTFFIYTEESNKVIARSVVRTAEDPLQTNKRVENGETPSRITEIRSNNVPMPLVDPEKLIGYSFLGEHAGEKQKVTITEKLDDDEFRVEYAGGKEGEITYDEIMNFINKKQEEGDELWTFKEILNHKTMKDANGNNKVFLKMLRDTGEET